MPKLLNLIKTNLQEVFIMVIIFALFTTYWNKYRPMVATKDCAQVADERIKYIKDENFQSFTEYIGVYKFLFDECMLVGYGIKSDTIGNIKQ